MCSHYQAIKDAERLAKRFGVNAPPDMGKSDMWPKYSGLFVRRPPEHESGDEAVPALEAVIGRWGLVSALTRGEMPKLSTFNARSETVAKSFTFGNAWRRAQHCIIPAEAVYEPDWRSGQAVATRFTRSNGAPLGIAGLWDRWRAPGGEILESYTMLTVNADKHPLFRNYHQVGKEKRMVVILPEGSYSEWLTATADESSQFLIGLPADQLDATAVA